MCVFVVYVIFFLFHMLILKSRYINDMPPLTSELVPLPVGTEQLTLCPLVSKQKNLCFQCLSKLMNMPSKSALNKDIIAQLTISRY